MPRTKTTFRKGQSGNLRGRPPGTGIAPQVREAIAQALPEILHALVERAKSGDTGAARLLLERCVPALRPVEMTVAVPVPDAGGLVERAEAIIAAVTRGELAPGQAADLLAALGGIARLKEAEEIEERLRALEGAQNEH